jgi:hypothetical protein
MSEVIEEIQGQGQLLNENSSNETLENLEVGIEESGHTVVNPVVEELVAEEDSLDKVSLGSDLTDDEDEEEEDKSVKLHISEENLSELKDDIAVAPSQIDKCSADKNICQENVQFGEKIKEINTSHVEVRKEEIPPEKIDVTEKKSDKSLTENRSAGQGDESSRSTKDSESSSGASRSYSESMDPYSLEAMEELERIGDEDGPDNSEFISMDETNDSIDMEYIGDFKRTGANIKHHDENVSKGGFGLDDSFTKMKIGLDLKPGNQSTPIKNVGRLTEVKSEPRQRPVSCIVTSGSDILDMSLGKRNSLTLSDEHLSGKYCTIVPI